MVADAFAVLADPTRRRILEEIGPSERSVGELVMAVGASQPTISKHLRVLREAGLVESRVVRQQRIYRVRHEPLELIDLWLRTFRELWTLHLDRLEQYLDTDDAERTHG